VQLNVLNESRPTNAITARGTGRVIDGADNL
jgi:hypothetical protein